MGVENMIIHYRISGTPHTFVDVHGVVDENREA